MSSDGIRKRTIIGSVFAIALLGSVPGFGQNPANLIEVRVDPRVELMSIIFRLAGNPEYNQATDYAYSQDVDRHFRLFKQHPAVQAATRLRNVHSVSYDAVMSMAIHLEDVPGLGERIPLDLPPEKLDERWPTKDAREFLGHLRAFEKDSGFVKFTKRHAELYEAAEVRLRELLGRRDYVSWFNSFFGARPTAKFIAIPGLLNGGHAYGPSVRLPDGREELYMVLGVWKTDKSGLPVFDEANVPTVVHEFCHSYVNAVVDRFADDLAPAAKKIFPHVEDRMRDQAYGNWLTMMREACVRACVARYVLEVDGSEAARQAIHEQHGRGFLWTGELVDLLGEYEADRSQYSTFDAFFPRVVRFFHDYAERDLETLLAPPMGPINSVFSNYRSAAKLIVVAPDGIRDKDVATRVSSFLAATHKQFYADSGVAMKKAKKVSRRELKSHALVAYGSPTSNKVIKRVAKEYEIVLEKDHVVVGGKRFAAFIARAIRTGFFAWAIPVLRSTPSAPSSIANVTSDAQPTPASTSTGTFARSRMIRTLFAFKTP